MIDLSECRHVDAAAIGLLLDVQRRLNRRGGVLTVRAPHPRIRRILDTADLGRALRVEASPPPAWHSSDGDQPARGGAGAGTCASPSGRHLTTGRRGERGE
ncbi:STAS domain-containing protein [Micromonospora chersina]|uniref:STAS domain-containing protein n=1 Tax=Micromonospora chersina TaxID=47854 RepID=UPI003F4D06C9